MEPGFEAALAAALGTLADAVAVSDVDSAQAAIELLKADDSGRAALLVGGADMPAKGDRPALPEGARWALDLVDAPEHMRAAVVRLLSDVVFAPDLTTARTIVSYAPELRTVTPAGDLLGAYAAAGGSAKAPSFIEVQAAVEEARRNRVAMEPGRSSCGRNSRPYAQNSPLPATLWRKPPSPARRLRASATRPVGGWPRWGGCAVG